MKNRREKRNNERAKNKYLVTPYRNGPAAKSGTKDAKHDFIINEPVPSTSEPSTSGIKIIETIISTAGKDHNLVPPPPNVINHFDEIKVTTTAIESSSSDHAAIEIIETTTAGHSSVTTSHVHQSGHSGIGFTPITITDHDTNETSTNHVSAHDHSSDHGEIGFTPMTITDHDTNGTSSHDVSSYDHSSGHVHDTHDTSTHD